MISHGDPLPLQINVKKFKYSLPNDTVMAESHQKIDLIDKITVPNASPATVSVSLSESQTLTQSWSISFTETITIGITGHFDITLPDIGGGGLSASLTGEFSSTQTIFQEIQRSYGISRDISIPPFTTIQAQGYVNWYNDIEIPFESTGEVYLDDKQVVPDGSGLIYCQDGTPSNRCYQTCGRTACSPNCVDGNICECCYLPITTDNAKRPNVIRDYLISKGIQAEVVGQKNKYLILRILGTFKASVGTDIVFKVYEIKGNYTRSIN